MGSVMVKNLSLRDLAASSSHVQGLTLQRIDPTAAVKVYRLAFCYLMRIVKLRRLHYVRDFGKKIYLRAA